MIRRDFLVRLAGAIGLTACVGPQLALATPNALPEYEPASPQAFVEQPDGTMILNMQDGTGAWRRFAIRRRPDDLLPEAPRAVYDITLVGSALTGAFTIALDMPKAGQARMLAFQAIKKAEAILRAEGTAR